MSTRDFLIYCVTISLISFSNAYCPERDACAYNAGLQIPSCYCDRMCIRYQDCCKEFLTDYNGKTPAMNNVTSNFNEIETKHNSGIPKSIPTDPKEDLHQENDVQLFQNATPNIAVGDAAFDESCISLTKEETPPPLGKRISAYMIGRCDGNMSMCEAREDDILSLLPVSDGNMTYRNVYCAACNGIENVYTWTMYLHITFNDFVKDYYTLTETSQKSETELFKKILKRSGSRMKYAVIPPPDHSPRYCLSEITEKTINTPDLYQNVIACNNSLYRNLDTCLSDGCCTGNETLPSCLPPSFDGYRNHAKEDTRIEGCSTRTQRNIQITIHPESDRTSTASKQSTQRIISEDLSGLKIRYEFLPTDLLFEAETKEQTPMLLIQRCVNDVLLLLFESKDKVCPTTSVFMSKLTRQSPSYGLKTFESSIAVQSNAALNLEGLGKVLNLKRSFRYKVDGGNSEILINVTATTFSELMSIFTFSRKDPTPVFDPETSKRHISKESLHDCESDQMILQVSEDGESIDVKCNVAQTISSLSNNATENAKQEAVWWLLLGYVFMRMAFEDVRVTFDTTLNDYY